MSVLYLNVYRLYVPNILSLGRPICIKNCPSPKLAHLIDTASRLALFSVFYLKDEKLIKKTKPTLKLKYANSILYSFEYFCQISPKSIFTISSYMVSKLVHFFLRHSALPRVVVISTIDDFLLNYLE